MYVQHGRPGVTLHIFQDGKPASIHGSESLKQLNCSNGVLRSAQVVADTVVVSGFRR